MVGGSEEGEFREDTAGRAEDASRERDQCRRWDRRRTSEFDDEEFESENTGKSIVEVGYT